MSNEHHIETLMKIGKELTLLRQEKGYTSHETFARTFNLPVIQYWRIERGKTNCTLKSLMKILDIHKIEIDDFFERLKSKNAAVR